jgi:adenylate cyclase
LRVGRAPDNDVVLEDRELSKHHAELLLEDGAWVLRDVGSSNGTYVNGSKIDRHRLAEGDLIDMGTCHFRFTAGGATASSSAVAIVPKSPVDRTTVIAAALPDEDQAEEVRSPEDLKRAYDRLRAALEAVRSLIETTDLRALCKKILEVTFRLLPAETGALLLFDENHQLVPWAHHGPGGTGERIIISRTIVDEVLRRRAAVLASDALTDARWGGAQSVVMSGVRSLMCVPLTSGNKVFGLLHVGNTREVGAFQPSDLELMTGIGSGAGLALSNAFLAHQVKEDARSREFLGRFLSPMVVEQVMARKIDLERGGKEIEVTVMFADIRGFTSLTERSRASDVVALLNEYFDQMVEVVFRHDGILDKFIGDALMAVWGAPIPAEDDASRALAAAQEMQAALVTYNQIRAERGAEPIAIGVGLASGRCVSGTIGAARRMEYTVIGDAVNLASRLAGVAGPGQVICDEETFRRAGEPERARPLPPAHVKGKTRPVPMYELLPPDPQTDED